MLGRFKKLAANDFVRGGMFYTFASTLVNILNYFFNFISARILGPQGLGEISTFLSYLSILAVPTTVISGFIIQKVASHSRKNEYASSLRAYLLRKIRNWWFVIILFLLLSPFMPQVTNLSFIAGVTIIPSIFILLIFSYYLSILQGLNLLIITGTLSVLTVIIKLAGPILVLLNIDGINTIILFLILANLIPLLITHFKFNSLISIKVLPTVPNIEKKVISLFYNRQFLLIFLSTLALNMLSNFDIVFVKKYFSSYEAGIYSSWSLFAKIILYGIGPLISVSFIFFSSEKGKSRNVFRISLLFLLLIGVVSYLGYTFFARLLINIFFGEKFIAVLPYLSSASLFGSLYAALSFINNYYVAKKSKISLIAPILIPFYILFLLISKRELSSIISLNIYFTLTLLVIQLIFYLKEELNFNFKSSK